MADQVQQNVYITSYPSFLGRVEQLENLQIFSSHHVAVIHGPGRNICTLPVIGLWFLAQDRCMLHYRALWAGN